ncbi:alpha/beta fold hydrolase [Desulfobulbus alkaliphilus]|uniref:alpha/beta fold hydrolase n=1 Tax=Desulfobulbus alkaliphilus TaxID=869814 RepID=UPI0019624C2B|nr:alpha/beta hydrolase [Desulfobulbus alkaliphilus]MBM9537126.1 alpha/beta hydrolase [Desulfobulbus alkaliphilus]
MIEKKRNGLAPTAASSNVRSCWFGVLLALALLLVTTSVQAQTPWPQMAYSKDGTPIAFTSYGTGGTTLVFVHGWSCDARYWQSQVPAFSARYHVVTLDLAGHGHSGMNRTRYTMQAFGEDVQAVVETLDARRVILIGHSMGGSVIAEAARLMPERVIGLIGVDTLENIEHPLTKEELEQMIAPLEQDFPGETREFVEAMLSPTANPAIREWILADMAAAPPAVALSAMREMMTQYVTGEAARIFQEIRVPVMVVNGDYWPVDYEANRRHMFWFDAIIIDGADHFLMLTRPHEFNLALTRAVQTIQRQVLRMN